MKKRTFTLDKVSRMVERNAAKAKADHQWKYEHLVDRGYYSMRLQDSKEPDANTDKFQSTAGNDARLYVHDLNKPMDDKEAATMWAYAMWLAAATSPAAKL